MAGLGHGRGADSVFGSLAPELIARAFVSAKASLTPTELEEGWPLHVCIGLPARWSPTRRSLASHQRLLRCECAPCPLEICRITSRMPLNHIHVMLLGLTLGRFETCAARFQSHWMTVRPRLRVAWAWARC